MNTKDFPQQHGEFAMQSKVTAIIDAMHFGYSPSLAQVVELGVLTSDEFEECMDMRDEEYEAVRDNLGLWVLAIAEEL
jgi:hypothetical protein